MSTTPSLSVHTSHRNSHSHTHGGKYLSWPKNTQALSKLRNYPSPFPLQSPPCDPPSPWTMLNLTLRFPTAAIRRCRIPVAALGTSWCRQPSFRSRGLLASWSLLDSVRPRFLSRQFFSRMLRLVGGFSMCTFLVRSWWFFYVGLECFKDVVGWEVR